VRLLAQESRRDIRVALLAGRLQVRPLSPLHAARDGRGQRERILDSELVDERAAIGAIRRLTTSRSSVILNVLQTLPLDSHGNPNRTT
jgi:hypothetical protein